MLKQTCGDTDDVNHGPPFPHEAKGLFPESGLGRDHDSDKRLRHFKSSHRHFHSHSRIGLDRCFNQSPISEGAREKDFHNETSGRSLYLRTD